MADVNISMPVNSSQKQLEQHPSLYFADGDLVIVACTDPAAANSIVFRVHGAILGLFSPVFAGMLSLPAPSVSGRELYDGVPLVHLSDDAKDMADFLDALYNPGFPIFKHLDPDFPLVTNGLMELATKYQVDSLSKRIISHLQEQWPKSLDEYIRREVDIKLWAKRFDAVVGDNGQPPYHQSAFVDFPEPASAIRLASHYNIPSVLPAAFYFLSTTGPENTWERALKLGFHSPDVRPARWEQLSDENLLRYYRGKYTLANEYAHIPFVLATALQHCYLDDCTGNFHTEASIIEAISNGFVTPCRQLLFMLVEEKVVKVEEMLDARSAVDIAHRANPLMKIAELTEDIESWGLCLLCQKTMREALIAKARSLWAELPKIFKLE